MGPIVAVAAVLACSPGILAQTNKGSGTAKAQTAVSAPDLSGVWVAPRMASGILPYAFVTEEPLPMKPWAAQRCEAIGCGKGSPPGRAKDETADPMLASCPQLGILRLLNHSSPFEIFQVPGRVLMFF